MTYFFLKSILKSIFKKHMFPKDILLKIVHHAHLDWIRDNSGIIESNDVIFEQRRLDNELWIRCSILCNSLYGKILRERIHKISTFENDVFKRMNNQVSSKHLREKDALDFQLIDVNGEKWDFYWGWDHIGQHYQLCSIVDFNGVFWGRAMHRLNIGKSILIFENISRKSNEKAGLFIYANEDKKIISGEFVDILDCQEQFPIVNRKKISWHIRN